MFEPPLIFGDAERKTRLKAFAHGIRRRLHVVIRKSPDNSDF
jgi:hypothetical protein